MKFNNVFHSKFPLIGMIHLPALVGYEKHPGMDEVIKKAIVDLQSLESAGFDGVLVENDNDQPHQIGVTPEIEKCFYLVMSEIKKKAKVPIGMEIIYDMEKTLFVASKVKADFVRFDVFVDSVKTKWGEISADPERLALLREKLFAENILFLTDIHVKHAEMLQKKSLIDSAKEAIQYGSDAIIITGNWTGQAPLLADCKTVKTTYPDFPLLIGSGLSNQNIDCLFQVADGGIVGSSIKTGDYIDLEKASDLVDIKNRL